MPFLVIFIGFVVVIYNSYSSFEKLGSVEKNISTIHTIADLINELQKERGISSGYLTSGAKRFTKELPQTRHSTDAALQSFLKSNPKETYLQSQVQVLRKSISSLELSAKLSFERYTEMISYLRQKYLLLAHSIDNTHIAHEFQTYTYIANMKEDLGQIRGAFSGIFSYQKLSKELLYKAISAQGAYALAEESFLTLSKERFKQKYLQIKKSKNYRWMHNTLQHYLGSEIQKPSTDPHTWFTKTTQVIETFHNLERYYFEQITHDILKVKNRLLWQLIFNISTLVGVTLLILFLGYRVKNSITRNLKLLSEYKMAVDRSSIVSKTDKHGRITYVNDKFCDISGYSKEELLGKSHNIVRHPSMKKETFKKMWQTILDKKPWYGVVTNRKKDGDYYIVEVTINPILNENGEIEEFIAIRNDITEVIKLHEEIEQTQEELILRMGEIGETRSQETGLHVKRVAKYSQILAQYYGLKEEDIKNLTAASPMHDIGKVAVPDSVLNKKGKLNQEEWKQMKQHSEIGYNLFKDSKRPLLQTAAIIAHEHHEKYDGSGYPRGLKGEDIHIFGRITALADVFDALGSERCYKQAWDDEKIFALIREESGKHFDPKLVEIFFEHLDEFLAARDKYDEKSSFMKEN